MSDPSSTSSTTSSQPGPGSTGDWREQRRAERHARWNARHDLMGGRPGWHGMPIGGVILLAIGVVVLLGNFGLNIPGHWWAVLLLVPAVGLLVTAIRFYRADNSLGGRVMGPAIGGILLLALGLSVFFGVSLGIFWPIVLIVVGLAIIARRSMR